MVRIQSGDSDCDTELDLWDGKVGHPSYRPKTHKSLLQKFDSSLESLNTFCPSKYNLQDTVGYVVI